jgi:DNA-binding NtrC family response regulator
LYKPCFANAVFLAGTGQGKVIACGLETNVTDRLHMASDNLVGEKARVLLVDDNPMLRRVMRRALEQAGVEVVEASNGQDALALAQQGHFGLVVTDVEMPVMDGLELLSRLSTAQPDLPVVLMSGSFDAWVTEGATHPAAREFLRKPFAMDDLKRCALRATGAAANHRPLDVIAQSAARSL